MHSPTSEVRVPYSGGFEMGIRAHRYVELRDVIYWVERWERDGDWLVLVLTPCEVVES